MYESLNVLGTALEECSTQPKWCLCAARWREAFDAGFVLTHNA